MTACATPTIRLTPSFAPGDERSYLLEASATTTIDIAGTTRQQRTRLRARSTVRILATTAEGTTMRLTLAPTTLELDDRGITLPGEQVAELLVASDGTIERITSVGGVSADIVGTDLQDLAPLLGTAMPVVPVEVGDRWTTTIEPPEGEQLAPGIQSGRVSALRVVQGFDTAIVSLATRRPLSRERTIGEQTVQLIGVETSSSEIAFAFREGFPVRISTIAEGNFDVGSGGVSAGTVRIVTDTEIVLEGSASR